MKGLNAYARLNLAVKLFLSTVIIIFINLFLKFLSSVEHEVQLTVLIISLVLILIEIIYIIFYPHFMNQEIMVLKYNEYLYGIIKSYETWAQSLDSKIKNLEETDARKFIISKKYQKNWNPDRDEKIIAEATIDKDNIIKEHRDELRKIQDQLNYYLSEHRESSKFLEKFHETSHQAG